MSRDIINGRQHDLLAAMVRMPNQQNDSVMRAAGMGDKKAYQLYMADMRERGLVSAQREERRVLLSVTERGLQAMADYQAARLAKEYGTATPSQSNWITAKPYQPEQTRAYYRNTGHKHIASVGVRC